MKRACVEAGGVPVSKTCTISAVNLDLQIATENALSIVVSTVTRFATADFADCLSALRGNIRRTVSPGMVRLFITVCV